MGGKPPNPCWSEDSSGWAWLQRLGRLARSSRMVRRRLPSCLGLAAAGLFLAAPAQAAPEERAPPAGIVHSATLSYQLYTIGLHPIDFSVALALDGGRYDIAVHGQTK